MKKLFSIDEANPSQKIQISDTVCKKICHNLERGYGRRDVSLRRLSIKHGGGEIPHAGVGKQDGNRFASVLITLGDLNGGAQGSP